MSWIFSNLAWVNDSVWNQPHSDEIKLTKHRLLNKFSSPKWISQFYSSRNARIQTKCFWASILPKGSNEYRDFFKLQYYHSIHLIFKNPIHLFGSSFILCLQKPQKKKFSRNQSQFPPIQSHFIIPLKDKENEWDKMFKSNHLASVVLTFPAGSLWTLWGGALFLLSTTDLTLTILEWMAQLMQYCILR